MVFIILKKAYDRVPRDLIWYVLDKGRGPRGYIEIIKGMYEEVVMSLRITYVEMVEFPLTIGFHLLVLPIKKLS